MTQLDDLRRRYAQFNDEYLLELAREADTFTPEALGVLESEIRSRKLKEEVQQEVTPDQVGDLDLKPLYVEPSCSILVPTVRNAVNWVRPRGPLLGAASMALRISKLGTVIIYGALTLSCLKLCTDPSQLGVGQLTALSSAISLATCAFLALRFAMNPGEPISTNGLAFICISSTTTIALLVLSAINESKSSPDIFIIPFYGIAYQWLMLLGRIGQIKFIKSSDIPNSTMGFLLLRSFRFDSIRSDDSLSPLANSIFSLMASIRWIPILGEMLLDLTYDFRYAWTYESLLRIGLEGPRKSPIALSLHNPRWKGISPVCGTYIRVDRHEDWRAVVRASLTRTEWVILMPGESQGLLEELSFIHSGDFPAHRILLLIPEDTPEDLLVSFAGALRNIGFDLSHITLTTGELYSFDSYWRTHRIAQGLESYKDAILEIKAWSSFKDRPDAEWCEFDHCQAHPTPAGRCPNCGLVIHFDRINDISQPDRGPGFQRPGLLLPIWEPIPLMDMLHP